MRSRSGLKMSSLVFAALLLMPLVASAAIFNVDDTGEAADANTGDSVCATAGGKCTLRAAIQQANALGGSSTINLPDLPTGGTVTHYAQTSALPNITADLTIVGTSRATTIISSNGPGLLNLTGGSLILSHAEVTGANTFGTNAIGTTDFPVTLDDVLVDGNGFSAIAINGVSATPTLTIANSTISNNSGTIGGGISSSFANVTATNVVFDSNSSTNLAGAVYHHGLGMVLFTNCTFTNNTTAGTGGGIGGDGVKLVVDTSTFSGNHAVMGGGAVDPEFQTVNITDTTFDGNSAGDGTHASAVGGALTTGQVVTITGSTFSNNTATGIGGAAFTGSNSGTMITATNSTFTGNTAGQGGGALATGGGSGQFVLSNVTVANNTVTSGSGGGIQVNFGGSIFKNTIIAANAATTDPDCAGLMITEDYNLVGDGSGCTINRAGDVPVAHDLVGTGGSPINPHLGALALNGSTTTRTLALLSNSPAGDAGNPTGCTDDAGTPITTDQRGQPRPVDGNNDGTARCDIGAYEAAAGTFPTPTTTTIVTTTTTTTSATSTTSTSSTSTTSTSTSTTSTTLVSPEICGDCIDNDGNGLTDFEDPACCVGAQAATLTLKKGLIKPGTGSVKLALGGLLSKAGLATGTTSTQDLFVQLHTAAGEVLCAKVPASALKRKKTKIIFKDTAHAVTTAEGVDHATVSQKKTGAGKFAAAGKQVTLTPPAAGAIDVLVGLRDPAAGDPSNVCAKGTATFKAKAKGVLKFP